MNAQPSTWIIKDRFLLPEPIGIELPVRFEHQHWQRLDRAEGELDVGYDAAGSVVRVEYHWLRYFSKANPELDDVYTAELWCKRPAGDWLYLVRPGQDQFRLVEHGDLQPLLNQHLNIDIDA